MSQNTTSATGSGIFVPVAGLTVFAIAAGYLMSLVPLSLASFNIDSQYAGWLASSYYIGLLIGSMMIEPIISKIGHRAAFIGFLLLLASTVIVLPLFANRDAWLLARLIAGMAVAGIFVVVESWLLISDCPKQRAKRLGIYMTSLYGGTTVGQLGVGVIGVQGFGPFIAVLSLLLAATLPAILLRQSPPKQQAHLSLSLKDITRLNKPAIIGCTVSGIVMGTIYGLMPLSLRQSQLDAEQISVLMAAIVLGGMAIQPIIGKLSVIMSKTLLLALMSLLGVFAVGLTYLSNNYTWLVVALALLGMSAFALYPIAITLACEKIDSAYIVAATQVMLFSYSIGSALGPIGAGSFLEQPLANPSNGLMDYFFIVLLATSIYMLLASAKRSDTALAS
ncbi:MFS transporter [Photobacterium sp. TY1-4]|uniref:MFS transporter n=1 Tax=Photobacterium sp. TY1-4 TaxID=2899122 RepID=UPI0021BF15F8|nr:MFS transporter [Photobacterium sp. TY1-4]UXI03784.1 MFS transporter [Photobacterium sp. TY1-4]